MTLIIRAFAPSDESAVVALWHACGLIVPWNDPHQDIQYKLANQPELFLVGELAGQVVAAAMAGDDGHRGWIYYLAVEPEHQRRGYGRQIVLAAVELLRKRSCPKVQLMVRSSNLGVAGFYESLGFELNQVQVFGMRLDGR